MNPPDTPGLHRARILLVDDEPEPRGILAGWLRQLGAGVTEAGDIAGAEAGLARESFDLILSDVHLPGNNRLQWTERLLARPGLPPLLLLTGNPEIVTALRAANLPVAGYLAKPPDFSTLRERLQELVRQHRRRVGLEALAREAAALAGALALSAPLAGKLDHLAACLATEAARPAREPGAGAWRDAIIETITVLEKTKHSFRSRELGQLRSRLDQLLGPRAA